MSNTPAGWYPDNPQKPELLRWWDGSQWTEHRSETPQEPAPFTGSLASIDEVTLPSTLEKKAPGGILGGKRALEEENAELRAAFQSLGASERNQLKQQIADLTAQRNDLDTQVRQIQDTLIAVSEEAVLQEVGVYNFAHPLDNAVAYQKKLEQVKQNIKDRVKAGTAVSASTSWHVDGSVARGRKMVNEIAKLMLRAYNNEADTAVRSMRPHRLDAAIKRLDTSQRTISRLGQTMGIGIDPGFHSLRLYELRLTSDYLARVAEEKEAEREEKARLREEAQAQKEFEREKSRLLKEQAHYLSALQKMERNGQMDEAETARLKLSEIQDAIQGVEDRAANIRAGYVYVISNIGSFGKEMVKVGLTRRLDPMDRVRELGDASVPFRYDVHAVVFSEDAVSLETALHQALEQERVNRINNRREFFYATPARVKELLTELINDATLLEYQDEPEAEEWRQSQAIHRARVDRRDT